MLCAMRPRRRSFSLIVTCSRLPDEAVVINEDCVGLIDPEFNCIGFRSLKEEFAVFPVCWDRNDTVR